MTVRLREYQIKACDAIKQSLMEGKKRPLVVAPTGSGKSLMIGAVAVMAAKKGNRTLILCSQGEILEQNEKTILKLKHDAHTGIFCAGLGRKERDAQIIFASRDSLGNDASQCGPFDFVIVDEAHLVPARAKSVYGKIFETLTPKWIVGFTGTPWRLDDGLICGPKGFFDALAYNIPMSQLIREGFLSPYRLPTRAETVIKTDGIKLQAGEFNNRQLTEASSAFHVINACMDIWEQAAADRRCSIFFCCSIAHAQVVVTHLEARGHRTLYLDGSTPGRERKEAFKAAREGAFRAIVNVGVLTTGVDIPIIDCVVMLRATQSASLFVQSIGRGLRLHSGKSDCLILDLTDNFSRFGSIEEPFIRDKAKKKNKRILLPTDGEPHKKCPKCGAKNHNATKVCIGCGYLFLSHGMKAHAVGQSVWASVRSYDMQSTRTRKGEDCTTITYAIEGGKLIKQWILYKRQWATEGRSQLKRMATERIVAIRLDDFEAKYPKVMAVKFEGEYG